MRGTAEFLALKKTVGENIRRLRDKNGWTQEKAAEATGVALAHLQKIEGGRVNMTLLTLHRLARAYDVRVADLLSED